MRILKWEYVPIASKDVLKTGSKDQLRKQDVKNMFSGAEYARR